MATAILIDDHLARQAQSSAERTGRSLVRFVEDAIARDLLSTPPSNLERPTGRASLMRTFGGDGIVDGLSLKDAIARAAHEDDLKVVALTGGADANG